MTLSPKIAVFTTISVLAYLALSVVGEGGVAAFASHPALLALVAVTLALSASALFTRGNLSSGVREDRSNRWVLAVFGLIGLLLGYLPAMTDRWDVLTIDGETTRWLGVALSIGGGALQIAPVFVLGKRFSGLVALQPRHELVTDGLYGVIRNPSYLGLLIGTLGWALAFRSGVGVLLTACLLPPLVARMRAEEALLAEAFGAQYETYRARTWRLIPGLY